MAQSPKKVSQISDHSRPQIDPNLRTSKSSVTNHRKAHAQFYTQLEYPKVFYSNAATKNQMKAKKFSRVKKNKSLLRSSTDIMPNQTFG